MGLCLDRKSCLSVKFMRMIFLRKIPHLFSKDSSRPSKVVEFNRVFVLNRLREMAYRRI